MERDRKVRRWGGGHVFVQNGWTDDPGRPGKRKRTEKVREGKGWHRGRRNYGSKSCVRRVFSRQKERECKELREQAEREGPPEPGLHRDKKKSARKRNDTAQEYAMGRVCRGKRRSSSPREAGRVTQEPTRRSSISRMSVQAETQCARTLLRKRKRL